MALRRLPILLALAGVASAAVGPVGRCRADAVPDAPAAQDTVVVDEKTEAVIKGALKWLALRQDASGAWTGSPEGHQHPVAVTAYTLMAFLATGNVPNEGDYGKNVARGVQYLVDQVQPDGYIKAPGTASNMYDHGIATIALAETYGQSKDPKLRAKLELAIKLVVSCQNREGGWRYRPGAYDADISVTVLQVVALRAAKNGGLDVPRETIDRAVNYITTCYDEASGGFTYQPHNRQPGFARTAAGVYSLQVCGLYDNPLVKKGSDYLFTHTQDGSYFTYGNFYAAPAQYMIGGETWRKWYETMSKFLLPRARQEGDGYSWPDLDGHVGPLYATAVYTTILAMPYHYVPLYQR